ncbi:Alpha/Beta hydrolase protein [Biscogniauxia marginata]|nr:Alpha/Beta hydrolase protein [Biscogniauxia marginata]
MSETLVGGTLQRPQSQEQEKPYRETQSQPQPRQFKFPSWPPRVCDIRFGRGRRSRNADDNTDDSHDNTMARPQVSQPFPRFLQMSNSRSRAGRLRRALLSLATLTGITLITLFIWLYRSGHIAGFDAVFKKTTTVKLAQGTYLGEVIPQSAKYPRAIQAFRGIPYAQSTGGQNRFKPPQPLSDINGQSDVLQHALKFGNICPQHGGGDGQGEDCLNLNIYRPHFGDDLESSAAEMKRLGLDGKKLPVVVYVHGGGFNTGRGRERNMGSFAAWADAPLIALSFNYRVGAFGFLPSSLTAKEGLLNLGLKDQQFFFEWVRNNVADIGGDPDNVTIMGLSAGAHSIGHHLISYSPANKLVSGPPPFQKAIIESGGSTARAVFVPNHPLHEKQWEEFLALCGIDDTPDDDIFTELRALPYSTLATASSDMWTRWNATLRWPFQPVIDGPGGVIPDLPINSWNKGNVLRIPILTGFNTNEGAVFVPPRASNSSALRSLMSSIIPALNETDLNTLNEMYPDPTTTIGKKMYLDKPPSGFGTQFWRLDDAYAHYAYICPVLQTAHLASTAENAAPVYTYQYAARSNTHGAADHADETPIVAHDMSVIGQYPGLVAMADRMTRAWSRFVATGDPNSGTGATDTGTPAWPKFVSPFTSGTAATSAGAGNITLFGEGNDERMGVRGRQNRGIAAQVTSLSDRVKEECRFWWDRVLLSEGYGNGSTTFAPAETIKAKL